MTDLATRRKRFRLALCYAGLTQAEAASELGVGAQHLSLVLNGRRESKRLLETIDAFAAEKLAELRKAKEPAA